ncbi:MAG TPA: hypothetical protein VGJ78_25900 [Vicinamibacterales bacterium]|jgi:electron transfer flavoprotein alpha/beta subunit
MPKTSSPSRRPASSRKKSGAIEIVVRRGSLKRFDALQTRTAELPVVVTWDRRLNERREKDPATGKKRRYAERRRTPPFTWELADFVVVEPPKRKKSARAPKAQAAGRKRQKTSKKS